MGALTLITSHLTTSFRRLCAVHKQPTPLGWYCNAIRINVMFKLCSTFSAARATPAKPCGTYLLQGAAAWRSGSLK